MSAQLDVLLQEQQKLQESLAAKVRCLRMAVATAAVLAAAMAAEVAAGTAKLALL
jgi:hypothetical protein